VKVTLKKYKTHVIKIKQSLEILAGPRAIKHIREHGLRPADIDIIPGAAGGPKGLGLAKLDEWLFADFLPQGFDERKYPIQLIGASIGAWRFASVCRGVIDGKFSADETRKALALFAKTYSETKYAKNVDAATITADARNLIQLLFDGHVPDVLSHPHYRLNVLAVRGKGILAREQRGRTHAGYMLAALANAAGRKHLRHFLDRTWFYSERETLALVGATRQNVLKMPASAGVLNMNPFFTSLESDPFTTEYAALTEKNFRDVLIATGSIPLVLEGVADIEGASEGTYWDGGLIDYHLHLPYANTSGLVLYPHFTNKIVPGWLDKMLPWRKASGDSLDNVVLVCPSKEYLDQLPFKKLPDRNDFKRFANDYEGRVKYWRFAMDESARLRDELAGLIESGEIVERLRAI
jgi:hypothetical protein